MKNKINCNVIDDLLPLYVDDVLSEESRALVEEHLTRCERCRENAEKMGKVLVFLNDTDSENIKKLKKKFSLRKLILASASGFFLIAVLFGLCFYLFYYGNAVSYDDVEVTTGFYKTENNIPCSSENMLCQGWVIDFELKSGKPLTVIEKRGSASDGENTDGIIFELREVPIRLIAEDSGFTFGFENSVLTPDTPDSILNQDQKLTVVYKDKVVVYSMREQGLYEWQNPSKLFKDYQ